jgi:hypothetical protein
MVSGLSKHTTSSLQVAMQGEADAATATAHEINRGNLITTSSRQSRSNGSTLLRSQTTVLSIPSHPTATTNNRTSTNGK